MCCRYYFSDHPYDDTMEKLLALMDRDYEGQYKTGEIFPGDEVVSVLGENGRLRHAPAVFGFPGFRKNQLILNARAETVTQKAFFSDAFREHRAILPAAGFFEWSHDGQKTKYLLSQNAQKTLYLCGIYKQIEGKNRFVILTMPANASMAGIHDRMPVIAAEQEVRTYLTDLKAANDILLRADPVLLRRAVSANDAGFLDK